MMSKNNFFDDFLVEKSVGSRKAHPLGNFVASPDASKYGAKLNNNKKGKKTCIWKYPSKKAS